MTEASKSLEERSRKIHKDSVVIDGLGGFGFKYLDILAGGVTATNVTIGGQHTNTDEALNQIRRYYGLIEMAPDRVMLVEEADDILKAKQQGKLGIIIGTQNATPIGDFVELLYIFRKLGLRIIQLTYNEANLLGCGCLEPADGGLTAFGTEVVQAMNRLGILIDLGHTGYQTSKDAIEISDDPVIFSHASPAALRDKPRNRPDWLIRLVAEKGGVMGLMPYSAFCKSAPGKRPTLQDFFDQIDYVVQLVGINHVGIGTDMFEGRTREDHHFTAVRNKGLLSPFEERHVEGFFSIRDFPRITEGLVSRNYSDEDIRKILGGNFLRVFKQVWRRVPF